MSWWGRTDDACSYLAVPKATLLTRRVARPGCGPRAIKAGGRLKYRLFRRTVATEIDAVHDAKAAKNQVCHNPKTVTERHYIYRKLVVPDYRAATERRAPGSRAGEGTSPGK